MTPERKTTINGVKIEEFYWAGKMVTYVDNHKVDRTYDEVVAEIRSNLGRDIEEEMMDCYQYGKR